MSDRDAFIRQLRIAFIDYLKEGLLRNWDSSNVVDLAYGLVEKNKTKIYTYLNENSVSFQNINQAIREIIEKILIQETRI